MYTIYDEINRKILYAFFGNFICFFPITQKLGPTEQNGFQILHKKIHRIKDRNKKVCFLYAIQTNNFLNFVFASRFHKIVYI